MSNVRGNSSSDVMKASNQIAALFFSTATFVACSNDPLLTLKETTETKLGPNGGIARSADSALELSFALGALTEETIIKIETIRDGAPIPRAPQNIRWELSPHGLQFGRDVFITIKTTPANEGDELAVANLDGAYPQVLASSMWDRENKFARATLQHFSSYSAVTVYNPCGGSDCGETCVICDPMNTSCTEPPGAKACNRSGLCVDASLVVCPQPPDSGIEDQGIADSGEPDAEVDAGVEDTGVVSCSEVFTQNIQPVVDILIIMDDSCSMYEEQATMASSFTVLHDTLVNNNADFHVGVTSTDIPLGAGMLLGTPTVLSSSTPNLQQAFAMNVSLGVNGSAFEEGLEAAQLALTAPANPGFLRDNSSLTVIYVSDEEDSSSSSTTAYANFLLNLRGPRRVQANAIVGPGPTGCTGQNGAAAAGERYDAIRVATGGSFDAICEAPWGGALTDLGGPDYGYLFQFTLSAPAVVLSVSVDGTPVSPSSYSYDAGTQTVEFLEGAVPGPGAVIEVFTECP